MVLLVAKGGFVVAKFVVSAVWASALPGDWSIGSFSRSRLVSALELFTVYSDSAFDLLIPIAVSINALSYELI